MRATCCGARSGRMATMTVPWVVSRISVSLSLMCSSGMAAWRPLCRPCLRAPVVDETDGERAAGQRVAERLGKPQWRAAPERVGDRLLIGGTLSVAGSGRQVGEPRLAEDLAGAGEADDHA